MTAETLAPALVKILEPDLGSVEVANLRILTGGASRATWAFDAVTAAGPRALILRTGPPDEVHAGMLLEARAQALAAAAGAPVPEVITADESTATLGAPFLIGGFIAGETIPRRILRALDDGSRTRLLGQCAAALVAIHRADISRRRHPRAGPDRHLARHSSTKWATPQPHSNGRFAGWNSTARHRPSGCWCTATSGWAT